MRSHPSGELSPGDMVGNETEARRNLSEAPDTLKTMSDSQSHPSGGLCPGETTTRPEPGGRQVLPEGLHEMAPGAALAPPSRRPPHPRRDRPLCDPRLRTRLDSALGLLADRLNTAARGGGGGSVNIHVDLATLARLDDNPADLAGYGPVTSETARRVAEAQEKSTWSAAATDPETGEPLHVISVKRRPTSKQRHMTRVLHTVVSSPGVACPRWAATPTIASTTPAEGSPRSRTALADVVTWPNTGADGAM